MKIIKAISFFPFVLFLTSCVASQIPLQQDFISSNNPNNTLVLESDVRIKAYGAKATLLRSGTHWEEVGSIQQGVVFRARDQVVVVNSYNVHEGHIVVSEDSVVGYYLPIEHTFVKSTPVTITFLNNES